MMLVVLERCEAYRCGITAESNARTMLDKRGTAYGKFVGVNYEYGGRIYFFGAAVVSLTLFESHA